MGKKGFTEEEWQIVTKTIYDRAVEYSKHRIYPIDSIFPPFKAEMKELGFEFEISMQLKQLCSQNPEKTRDIVMKYYDKCIYANEKAFLISCLMNKNNKDLVPFFIKEFYGTDNVRVLIRSDIGNFFMETADIMYLNEYLKMLEDESLGDDRGFIIWAVDKLKCQESIPFLIKFLGTNLTYLALKSLNKYKNPEFLQYFERYKNDKNTDIRNVAKKGIANIEKILNKEK